MGLDFSRNPDASVLDTKAQHDAFCAGVKNGHANHDLTSLSKFGGITQQIHENLT